MKNDFVEVKLSAAGERAAGGKITLVGPRYHFTFEPGVAQRVSKAYDWEVVLRNELVDGEPMFELVVSPAPPSKDRDDRPWQPGRRNG